MPLEACPERRDARLHVSAAAQARAALAPKNAEASVENEEAARTSVGLKTTGADHLISAPSRPWFPIEPAWRQGP